jgi:hypothetical protein
MDKKKWMKEKISSWVGAAVAALKPHKGLWVRGWQNCQAWGVRQIAFLLA